MMVIEYELVDRSVDKYNIYIYIYKVLEGSLRQMCGGFMLSFGRH